MIIDKCTITPIDEKEDLFAVLNLLPNPVLDRIAQEDFLQMPFTTQERQENRPRRKLKVTPKSVLHQVRHAVDSNIKNLSKVIKKKINKIDTYFWLDLPGFSMDPHVDNEGVSYAMQIYLKKCDNAGTVFYNENTVRHTFDHVPNNGYIMVNNSNQKHAVPNTVAKDTYRLSCYCLLQT